MPFSVNAQRPSNEVECGTYIHVSPPNIPEEDKTTGDRFGNKYAPYELFVTTSNLSECDCSDLNPTISTDYFQLYFIDCLEETGTGFDLQNPIIGSPSGEDYRKVLCQVFHDLSTLIVPFDPNATVKIRIASVLSEENIPPDALGVGSSWYDNIADGGLLYGRAWKAINSTQPTLPNDFYDGYVKISFLNTTNPYNVTIGTSPGTGEYDLYTVAYHEALHLLGFTALLNGDGTSSFTNGISFSRFAAALALDNGFSVIVNEAPLPSPVWTLNTPNVTANDLHHSCLDVGSDTSGPDMLWVHSPTQSYPVYTGASQNTGSSFSHFENDCDGATVEYLMRPGLDLMENPVIHDHEKQVLCDLGYTLSDPNFGCDNTPCAVVGNYDVLLNSDTGLSYEYCPGEDNFFIIDINDVNGILANDINADDIALLTPAVGVNNVIVEETGTGIFKVSYLLPGFYKLRYIPISNDANCTVQGNVTFISFQVTSCLSQCVFADGTSPDCTDYNNECNLICNPEFCGEPLVSTNNEGFLELFNADVPGWATAFDTPDWYYDYVNNRFWLGVLNRKVPTSNMQPASQESVFSRNTIGSGKYLYAIYHYSDNLTYPDQAADVNLEIALIKNDLLTEIQNLDILSNGNTNAELNITTNNYFKLASMSTPTNLGNDFIRSSGCTEIPNGFVSNAIYVYSQKANIEQVIELKTYFDQLEIVKDVFNATVDNESIICGESAILGGDDFCMLSNVDIEYYWATANAPNDKLLVYKVRKNSDGTTLIHIAENNTWIETQTIPTLSVSPNVTTCYRLYRKAITSTDTPNANTDITELNFCNEYDEVCVSVTGFAYDATFDIENCADLTLTVVPVDNTNTQTWDFGDGTVISSNGQNETHTYAAEGIYTIPHTVGASCPSVYQVTVTMPDCENPPPVFACPCDNPNSYNLQLEATGTTLSSLITAGTLPDNSLVLTGNCMAISGRLIIDVPDYLILNGRIKMQPASTILVKEGASLTLRNINEIEDAEHKGIYGCVNLWRGITVEKNATLAITGCDIQDAWEAILPQSESVIQIDGTVFERNAISIEHNGTGFDLSYFVGNTFDGSGNLLPLFDDFSFFSRPVAGIVISSGLSTPTFHIGNTAASPNHFVDILNGIITTGRMNLIVDNTIFENIQENPSETYSLQGFAIHTHGANSLYQRGLGKDPINSPVSFNNCRTAIWSSFGGDIDIASNNMQNVKFGTDIQNSQNRSIKIHSNYMKTVSGGRGIQLFHNDPAFNIAVRFNDIDLGHKSFGITIDEMNNPHTNAIIEENTINGNVGINAGISMYNTNNIDVERNTIRLNTPYGWSGIAIKGGQNCLFSCNEIFGSGGSATGLDVWKTTSTQYNCNDFTNLHTGMKFTGDCDVLQTTNIKGNDFFPPFNIGLYYTESTMINGQAHKGNQWHGNAGDYTDVAAKHDGNVQSFIEDARYEVHTTSPPFYPPSLYPSPLNVSWFSPTQGTPETCGEAPPGQSGEDCPAAFIANPKIGNWAIRAAKGEAISSVYPATALWEMQKVLHKSLKENPALLGEDAFVDMFYYTTEGNTMGTFNAIESNTFAAWTSSTTELTQIQLLSKQLALNIEDLIVKDVLIAQASSPALLAEREILLQNIHTQSESMEVLFTVVNTNRDNITATLKSDNTAILSTTIYENNEKSVNDIYLSTIASGSDDFTAAQKATLLSIAQQCPLEGGNAVFKARALYALEEDMEYDDDILCGNQALMQTMINNGIEEINEDKKVESKMLEVFHLYPNPVKDILTLEYYLAKEGQLAIFDLYGRKVMQKTLLPDNVNIQINTQQITNGIYLLKIFDANSEHFFSKIIIQH